MAEEVRDLEDMLLSFDCPNCVAGGELGNREIVEMRSWRPTGKDGGEWVHYFACSTCGLDLSALLTAENRDAVAREEQRRGRTA